MIPEAPTTGIATVPVPIGRQIGRPGRVALSSAMAGGIALGGVAAAFLALLGEITPHGLIWTATELFLTGGALGFLCGAALGCAGRRRGRSSADTLRSLAKGALYAIPGLSVAWLTTTWICMTALARYNDAIPVYVVAAAGWICGGIVVAWATIEGVVALRSAFVRRYERVLPVVPWEVAGP